MLLIKKTFHIFIFLVSILNTNFITTNNTIHYVNYSCVTQTTLSSSDTYTNSKEIISTHSTYCRTVSVYFKRLYYSKKTKKHKHEHKHEDECHEEENDEHDEEKEADDLDEEDSLHGQEIEEDESEDDNEDKKKQKKIKDCKKILLALCNTQKEQELVRSLNNEQASYLLNRLML